MHLCLAWRTCTDPQLWEWSPAVHTDRILSATDIGRIDLNTPRIYTTRANPNGFPHPPPPLPPSTVLVPALMVFSCEEYDGTCHLCRGVLKPVRALTPIHPLFALLISILIKDPIGLGWMRCPRCHVSFEMPQRKCRACRHGNIEPVRDLLSICSR